MVIATSKESRRVLTGSIRRGWWSEGFNYRRETSTIAQRDVQDDTDGGFGYFEIFWMDWQWIGKAAFRRDRFRIGFQQRYDSLGETCFEEIASVLI